MTAELKTISTTRVLIMDVEPAIDDRLQLTIDKEGWNPVVAYSMVGAWEKLQHQEYTLSMVDLHMRRPHIALKGHEGLIQAVRGVGSMRSEH
jgi:DNA-binding NtrC family response regulator